MDDDGEQPGTRDKILIAAATMLGEDPTARLSVRGVAARAGVSTGSLRHFFPTQRELVDTVVDGLDSVEIPDDPIHDAGRTPGERLASCLQLMLEQVGTGEQARAHWRRMHDAYIAATPTEDETLAYLALARVGRHRIVRWLAVLADEGALPADDVERRARLLATVLSGLFAERALPADGDRLEDEQETLHLAVASVLTGPHHASSASQG